MSPRSSRWLFTMIRMTAEHWILRRLACCVHFSEHYNGPHFSPCLSWMPAYHFCVAQWVELQFRRPKRRTRHFVSQRPIAMHVCSSGILVTTLSCAWLLSQMQLGAWEKIFRVKEGIWSFLHISDFLKATWTSPMWFLIGAATSCLVWVEAVWMQRVKRSAAVDSLEYMRPFWQACWEQQYTLQEMKERKDKAFLSSAAVIDAKALYDAIRAEVPQLQDKRTQIEVMIIKQKMEEMAVQLKWVPSEIQISDGLTKLAARQLLADRLRTHKMSLKADNSFQAAKKKTPKERKDNARCNALSRGDMSKNLALMIVMSQVHPVVTMEEQTEEHYDMLCAVYIRVTIAFLFAVYGMVELLRIVGMSLHWLTCSFLSRQKTTTTDSQCIPVSDGEWAGEVGLEAEREEWRVAARDQFPTPAIKTVRGANPVAPDDSAASARRGTSYASPLIVSSIRWSLRKDEEIERLQTQLVTIMTQHRDAMRQERDQFRSMGECNELAWRSASTQSLHREGHRQVLSY